MFSGWFDHGWIHKPVSLFSLRTTIPTSHTNCKMEVQTLPFAFGVKEKPKITYQLYPGIQICTSKRSRNVVRGCVRGITCWGYPLKVNSCCFSIVIIRTYSLLLYQGANKIAWLLENNLVNALLSQSAVSKTTVFLETNWKMSPTVLNFDFICDIFFKGWNGLENWQNFRVHKIYLMTLVLPYVVGLLLTWNANVRDRF